MFVYVCGVLHVYLKQCTAAQMLGAFFLFRFIIFIFVFHSDKSNQEASKYALWAICDFSALLCVCSRYVRARARTHAPQAGTIAFHRRRRQFCLLLFAVHARTRCILDRWQERRRLEYSKGGDGGGDGGGGGERNRGKLKFTCTWCVDWLMNATHFYLLLDAIELVCLAAPWFVR